jgi:3'-phosphoadenosine 5'-phosphosulfate sulfotransferase (PAPS reductase)/FAD synthetase
MGNKVVCWWSGGITSAVACKLAIDLYGLGACLFIMIDTGNEDQDTYRFKTDCERWYGKPIEVIRNRRYENIQQVWRKFKSLNVAHGAICSSELKREVRQKWEKENDFDFQVFGFDIDEPKRARAMRLNYGKTNPIFPLLMFGYSKKDCLEMVHAEGIEVPNMYKLGFGNNNCFKTGCIQGGIGYWQKMMREFPEKFEAMAKMEHELTDLKGKPVTMLKDQSKSAKESGNVLVFLKKHPSYPNLKDITQMPDCKVEPLMECNGFCGVNDLSPNREAEAQLNFEFD